MKNSSKLPALSLLENFSSKELKGFEELLNCHYFNTDKRILNLFFVLKKKVLNKQAFNSDMQVKVYYTVFSDQRTTANLTSKQKKALYAKMGILYDLVKRFLRMEALEDNRLCQHILLNKKLLEKKQLKNYERILAKDKKHLAKEEKKGLQYYQFSLEVEASKLDYLYQKGVLVKENNLNDLSSALDLFYLLQKLKLHSTALALSRISKNETFNLETIETSSALSELSPYNTHPLVSLYKVAIQLMQTNESTFYDQLLDLLECHFSVLPDTQLQDFYTIASNFCVYQIRVGQLDYYQKHYQLHQLLDRKNLLKIGAFISIQKLKNVISTSCHIGDFEGAKAIANKYKSAIEKDLQESIWQFNLGVIAFYQAQYKEAISHFIRVHKINLSYDLDGKIMLIKSHYELDEDYDERSMQIFRSAVQFIKNNKALPASHRKSYTNLIQLLINLYRIKHRAGKMTLEKVQNKIAKMEFIGDKRWLLEKLEELN